MPVITIIIMFIIVRTSMIMQTIAEAKEENVLLSKQYFKVYGSPEIATMGVGDSFGA